MAGKSRNAVTRRPALPKGYAVNPPAADFFDFLRIEKVLDYVRLARKAQIDEYGEGEHFPTGTGHEHWATLLAEQKTENVRARQAGQLSWRHLLLEDFYSAMTETNVEILKVKIAELGATCLGFLEQLEFDR